MQVNVISYIGIVLLILCSAFFSGCETAYAGANKIRLRAAADNGKNSAKTAFSIYNSYDNALITILVGNNLVNNAASSIATVIAISLLGDDMAWIATVVMTVLIITFGEIVPKIIATACADGFATAVSLPLKALMVVTYPLTWLVNTLLSGFDKLCRKRLPEAPAVTEEDLETSLDTVEDEGVIDEDRADLLQSALDFDEVLAYEVITPRVDMVAIDVDDHVHARRNDLVGKHLVEVERALQ